NPHHAVDGREHQNDARSLGFGQQPAQAEDNAAFVLGQDLDRTQEIQNYDGDDNGSETETEFHHVLTSNLKGLILRRIVPQTQRSTVTSSRYGSACPDTSKPLKSHVRPESLVAQQGDRPATATRLPCGRRPPARPRRVQTTPH